MMEEKWDENKYPYHMRMDVRTRNENIDLGKILCKRCDGTGNEFYSMYSECKQCEGKGYES